MIKVLDHGYVKLIPKGCWGSDEIIIESARMSTAKGFLGWEPRACTVCWLIPAKLPTCKTCEGTGLMEGDTKLLRYLWNNSHHTPFEMAGMTIEVQAPIFVFREWHRHRTQSYNELSARYTELPDLYYVPSVERLMAAQQSNSNKQASEDGLSELQASNLAYDIKDTYRVIRESYENLLRLGLAREVARVIVPVGQYSRMRASANLRNWLHFATLRTGGGAQWEIQQYAKEVCNFIEQLFPRTYALWRE